ncbi:hypothetical protein H2204_003048 [Knufia peltigerae]|uniref:Uncharacterized protein n=1 Tax=Knufia peltigerae TaxID=1002370 RepID=A0AA39CZW0_9EURO|nr:hypothetical protein H2204_003048 [Knufia peltigerae]
MSLDHRHGANTATDEGAGKPHENKDDDNGDNLFPDSHDLLFIGHMLAGFNEWQLFDTDTDIDADTGTDMTNSMTSTTTTATTTRRVRAPLDVAMSHLTLRDSDTMTTTPPEATTPVVPGSATIQARRPPLDAHTRTIHIVDVDVDDGIDDDDKSDSNKSPTITIIIRIDLDNTTRPNDSPDDL